MQLEFQVKRSPIKTTLDLGIFALWAYRSCAAVSSITKIGRPPPKWQ